MSTVHEMTRHARCALFTPQVIVAAATVLACAHASKVDWANHAPQRSGAFFAPDQTLLRPPDSAPRRRLSHVLEGGPATFATYSYAPVSPPPCPVLSGSGPWTPAYLEVVNRTGTPILFGLGYAPDCPGGGVPPTEGSISRCMLTLEGSAAYSVDYGASWTCIPGGVSLARMAATTFSYFSPTTGCHAVCIAGGFPLRFDGSALASRSVACRVSRGDGTFTEAAALPAATYDATAALNGSTVVLVGGRRLDGSTALLANTFSPDTCELGPRWNVLVGDMGAVWGSGVQATRRRPIATFYTSNSVSGARNALHSGGGSHSCSHGEAQEVQ